MVTVLSGGVNRTGTFIAIDRIIFQIERERMVDVFGIVSDMCMHRPFMVKTKVRDTQPVTHRQWDLFERLIYTVVMQFNKTVLIVGYT